MVNFDGPSNEPPREKRNFDRDAQFVDSYLTLLDSFENEALNNLKSTLQELKRLVAAELEKPMGEVSGKDIMEVYQRKVEEFKNKTTEQKQAAQDGFVMLCEQIKNAYSELNKDEVYPTLTEENLQIFVSGDTLDLAFGILYAHEFNF